MASADDLALPHDDTAEWTAAAGGHALVGELDGLAHEVLVTHRAE
jgi:hypothetical protein